MLLKNKINILYKTYGEFIRFCIVGIICTLLDACIFYCVRLFATYPVSLVCGYLLSLIVNYFLTVYWTFSAKSTFRNLIGIILAHVFNLFIVRMGLMYIFVDILDIHDRIAYIPTLLISMITNFLIIRCIVKKSKSIDDTIG